MNDTPIEKMSFEQALAELETVVSDLEGGNIPLEQSILLYERGAKLKAHCERKLAAAEEKVAQITRGPDGAATGLTPVDPD
ncbi:exodeoxyribonuclease VII small subunit [Halovulum dunhuangense]|uniref:Exodeoxyribonuclease 7 small subunit n=1 Tax=Halovulum dunhuangense TaxID=1505036 RepID=A0A849KQF3_9RHOB|nr:exodeoxyribonuclease VII small subunit [Halovulum dunhuangense]NNU79303.1 exodeoxyribonuclease VII small subunit [Halovulum dunhuangense]